ncbi:bifunctional [glutamine synthetase] adenylyltransferase/[glutamine synthetase]-adenylyl-L-tyrosine phosphorylase [Roseobacter ponti]|uniref:Bifunctional [glutamine synthetase] adenylyltransferase/[glutamine synthetase]-adenylyl-L-tyrosine phosphorylase n=1 Tax=Roseobacter ponti TaxID=1891787 RepID=A0A858SRR9_9RHOB|nr:bifunctional [glutamine synthetase] adenylyltransferase/[glutamine synthetase]-adenylyl-L-tyrosine phosphorylase [Roseobacter ponti]QJF51404.1 bifunctional [glutamine synthetase] adenylyltransferase/[glutamine synthetase]-adenylyl-L-tyrosine phosphorylase [Roseobacter ponti]
MTFASKITRTPRPWDAQRGADAVAALSLCDPALAALLRGTAGCSPYLAGLITREGDWLEEALDDPDAALDRLMQTVTEDTSGDLRVRLRRTKRRVALITALADLGGAWPLEKVTGTLTRFADIACQVALRAGLAVQIRRDKLPGMTEDDLQDAAGMVVLAMGKMGAGELNYSSDIDLICLFDETRFDPDDFHDARAAFVRATRMMSATLSEMTADGYVFRTDLRLRPDPAVTPVCMSMEAAERYYESLGRTWERAAYIKARVAAGDAPAGARFLKALTPFVWRRHLDFAAIQDAHDMRLAIRTHKGLGGPITLPAHNMKLGRGGIREIEFFTQTRQLIAGGRDPDLRCRGTVPGLEVLARKGWITSDLAAALSDHYVAHRTVEHRLQMMNDAQTHTLPATDEGFGCLAAMMDTDADSLKTDLSERLAAVHEMTEGFFAPTHPAPAAQDAPDDLDEQTLARWLSYPALRSERSRLIFERLRPDLLKRLAGTARPADALRDFDGFLAGLPAGVQLFSLLEANPQLADLLIDITGTSPALAQYLSRNAAVFDAVIGGDFFTDWPGAEALAGSLSRSLDTETDYEARLDAMRRWTNEWHFRVGVHLLRGLISPDEAGRQYADIARSVLCVLWPLVCDQFARRHGAPPGRGAVVLGMGSLGAGRLTPGSDLDLIVIYDPQDAESSNGERPLATRPYYARLTQALITALTAPMSQGRLYEVDMRLRPSGNQGPVATSWPAFQSYQREQAWIWEHLALTRAGVVAGPDDLTRDVEAFREGLLGHPRPLAEVAREVAQMRDRIRAAKAATSLWDTKTGPGRLQEIELIAQSGALIAGHADSRDGMRDAVTCGLIDDKGGDILRTAGALFSAMNIATRLLSETVPDPELLGMAAHRFVLRATDQTSLEALQDVLEESYDACAGVIDRALADYAGEETREKG